MAESITIQSVSKTFDGQVRAIDHVSLDIRAGELFFLLGPSGCGKTTLLRAIAGFVQPDAGTVHLGTREITHEPPYRRNTGMVFQSYALWPHLTISRNVAFGLEMRKFTKSEIASRTRDALERVQMAHKAEAKPNQLSGGQQQRVALARALVIEPQCLLLDEPLSNLDAKLRLEMRQEIRRICKAAGITALYVTHDQKEALSIADRLAILDQGRVQQVGTPDEVYRRPSSVFVAGFIGESNFLKGRVSRADGPDIVVDTDAGPLLSRPDNPAAFSAGMELTVSIRPEAVHTLSVPEDAPNRMQAQLQQSVYLGESSQQVLHVGNTIWKAYEWNPQGTPQSGKSVTLSVDPSHVVLLKE